MSPRTPKPMPRYPFHAIDKKPNLRRSSSRKAQPDETLDPLPVRKVAEMALSPFWASRLSTR